jgi:hypothetical protein
LSADKSLSFQPSREWQAGSSNGDKLFFCFKLCNTSISLGKRRRKAKNEELTAEKIEKRGRRKGCHSS